MSDIVTRPAVPDDTGAMAEVLQALIAVGKRRKQGDAPFVLGHYITHPDQTACHVALRGEVILGFQSLKIATPGNPYGTPVGWGIIGTHIRPQVARSGVGRALSVRTMAAARAAGISRIEAQTGTENLAALAFYGAIGFAAVEGGDPGVLIRDLELNGG